MVNNYRVHCSITLHLDFFNVLLHFYMSCHLRVICAALRLYLHFGLLSFWYVLAFFFLVYCVDQRVNFAKLGTGSLWRYWQSFHLVGVLFSLILVIFLSISHQIPIQLLHLLKHFSNSNMQAHDSPNPTKEQLVSAVQQHFSSQVCYLALYPHPSTHTGYTSIKLSHAQCWLFNIKEL